MNAAHCKVDKRGQQRDNSRGSIEKNSIFFAPNATFRVVSCLDILYDLTFNKVDTFHP